MLFGHKTLTKVKLTAHHIMDLPAKKNVSAVSVFPLCCLNLVWKKIFIYRQNSNIYCPSPFIRLGGQTKRYAFLNRECTHKKTLLKMV